MMYTPKPIDIRPRLIASVSEVAGWLKNNSPPAEAAFAFDSGKELILGPYTTARHGVRICGFCSDGETWGGEDDVVEFHDGEIRIFDRYFLETEYDEVPDDRIS